MPGERPVPYKEIKKPIMPFVPLVDNIADASCCHTLTTGNGGGSPGGFVQNDIIKSDPFV